MYIRLAAEKTDGIRSAGFLHTGTMILLGILLKARKIHIPGQAFLGQHGFQHLCIGSDIEYGILEQIV